MAERNAHTAAMPTRLALLCTLLPLLLLGGCAAAPPARDAAPSFVVVRHGEKTSDTGRDPDLSTAGLQRAQALARELADADLVAIYSTDLRRTRQTVAPTAQAHGLTPALYDPRTPAAEFIAGLKAKHGAGTVLIAGHSNTVPALVAALCACAVADMPETEYDRLSIIRFAADGTPRLDVARYGGTPSRP